MHIPKVIDTVVNNDLCIGCGLCVYACPSKTLKMKMNEFGFLIPTASETCDLNENCVKVCPFNPFPDKEVKTETEIANHFLIASKNFHPKIGKFNAIYAGYSNEFRLTSSSGGIATYIFTKLLDNGMVEYVFSVKESTKPNSHYEYAISRTKKELLEASKTKYYPVTLAEVMSKIKALDGRVAISGVACFIKAVRLAQYKEPELRDKIPFLVGIICGGLKSSFFAEYLASKAGIEKQNMQTPRFRIKDYEGTAGDYSYGCIDKSIHEKKTIKMRTVGDMWGTGLFKANACDFCDDVTTELADISLGDAWLPPYNKDGRGTNVVVARSAVANQLIQEGIKRGELTIDALSLDRFLASQQGSFNHRHTGLLVRIKQAKKKGQPIPAKRIWNEKVTIDFRVVQILRMKVRQKSLDLWKANPKAEGFDKKMSEILKKLKLATKIYHYRREFDRRINKVKKKL